jgi:hypothetical protein
LVFEDSISDGIEIEFDDVQTKILITKIMVEAPTRYSDADLAEFKEIILNKIHKAQFDLDLIKSAYMNDLNNGTDDTSPHSKHLRKVVNLCLKRQTHS